MNIKKAIPSIIFFVGLFSHTNAQDYKALSQKVLLRNIKDKKFEYNNDSSSAVVTYLGSVTTIKGKKHKFITIKSTWGINKHTSGYIWIYDSNNRYLGRYVLGDANDLPLYISNGGLIFSNQNKNCSTAIKKKINFANGIPRKIFIPACEEYGDIYEFSE